MSYENCHTLYSERRENQNLSLLVNTGNDEFEYVTHQIFAKKELAVVGMSLGNSYFSEKRIRFILSGLSSYFKEVAVIITDEIAIHNFRAMGYTEQKSQSKVTKSANALANKINRAIATVENNEETDNASTVHTLSPSINLYRWKQLNSCPAYQETFEQVQILYHNHSGFSSAIRATTLQVMKKHITSLRTINSVVDEAKWYLLKECAFALAAPDFFRVPLLTAYYTDFPIYRRLLSGFYTGKTTTEHEFITYQYIANA